MKIVAYYHEETDAHGVTRKSVGLENRETVMDEPLVLERDALAEIDDWRRGAKAEADAGDEARAECRQLRAELAAIKAQEPVVMDVLRDVADSLRHFMGVFGQGRIKDGKALDAADSLLAAPVVSAEQQGVAPDEMRSLAQRLREYNTNPHHINQMSDAFHILVADAATALSTACVPKEIATAITWADHLLFECGALTSTRAPSAHVYNKTFEAVNTAKAMLAAAPAAPAAEAYPHGHPLHREVFMALESWTGSDTFEDGVRALIAALATHRAKGVV